MGLLDNIKMKFGEMQLRRGFAAMKRDRVVSNLDDAKTVGIVFLFTGVEDFDLLRKYVAYLREMKKKVKAVGLYTEKELPNFPYSKLEFDFFDAKSLNWQGIPTDHVLLNFIEEPFDILIDLNLTNVFPLKYITAASKAHFKVGLYREDDQNIHDFLINTEAAKGLKFFMRQVDTYLLKINKPAGDSGAA